MAEVPELTPSAFHRRWSWPQGGDAVVLLDVRAPEELAAAAVPGAVHIPMSEIPARLDELPPDQAIVVMCHSGGRSRRVAEFLHGRGFADVFNLTGGIDAWSREIDPQIPRY